MSDSATAVSAKPQSLGSSLALQNGTAKLSGSAVAAVLAFADVVALLTALTLVQLLAGSSSIVGGQIILLPLSLPLWLFAFKTAGLYDRDYRLIHHTTINEAGDLARVVVLCTASILAVEWLIDSATVNPLNARVGLVFAFCAAATFALVSFRGLARVMLRRDSRFRQNTLIVGAGNVGQLLGLKLLQHPEYRLQLLGFVDGMPKERRPDLDETAILGSPDDLSRLVSELNVDRVIIAFSNDSPEDLSHVIRILRYNRTYVDIVPRLFDVIPPGLTSHGIGGIPLISLPSLNLTRWSRFLKRSMDLSVSLALLIPLAPVFAIIAAIVKLDSPGPIFFKQIRMGADEKEFRIRKFRTMVVDADNHKSSIAHLNRHARPGGDPRMFKVVGDPRVTTVGRFLRRYSLDELPQLINVLLGEMSLVGPRPLILEEDRYIEDWGRMRLSLKPGITGLWQVSGRNCIPFEEMVKLDYLYVTNWSLAADCRLLLQTVPIVLRGDAM